MPPSSLAFSAFLHFSFRHCLAREASSFPYGLAYWPYPSLFPVILYALRHPLTCATCIDGCYAIFATYYFLLVINSTWLSITSSRWDIHWLWASYWTFYSVGPSVCWKHKPLVTSLRFISFLNVKDIPSLNYLRKSIWNAYCRHAVSGKVSHVTTIKYICMINWIFQNYQIVFIVIYVYVKKLQKFWRFLN